MSDDVRIISSGGNISQRGVALCVSKRIAANIVKIEQRSDRILLIKIAAKPVDVVIIQVYMPTSKAREETIESIYEEIEDMLGSEKGNDYIIVMGDFNAVVGEDERKGVTGKYGLGKKNKRDEMLINFCERNDMLVTNSVFQHHKRRRYTWKMPGGGARYQIDYILVRNRFRNSVKDSRSYPGSDAHSDHNLVMMKAHVRLKKIR